MIEQCSIKVDGVSSIFVYNGEIFAIQTIQ